MEWKKTLIGIKCKNVVDDIISKSCFLRHPLFRDFYMPFPKTTVDVRVLHTRNEFFSARKNLMPVTRVASKGANPHTRSIFEKNYLRYSVFFSGIPEINNSAIFSTYELSVIGLLKMPHRKSEDYIYFSCNVQIRICVVHTS